MSDKYPPTNKLTVSWITNNLKSAPVYPSGINIDVSHAAEDTCSWSFAASRVGLYFVECQICGSHAQIVTGGGGTWNPDTQTSKRALNSITLPCRYVENPLPAFVEPSPPIAQPVK